MQILRALGVLYPFLMISYGIVILLVFLGGAPLWPALGITLLAVAGVTLTSFLILFDFRRNKKG